MLKLSEMIESATTILAKENGWCQRAGTRDAAGAACPHDSPDVFSYCLDGAVYRAALNLELRPDERYKAYGQTIGFIDAFVKNKHSTSAVRFNDADDQTQEGVVSMLKEAAIQAREKEVSADVGSPAFQMG